MDQRTNRRAFDRRVSLVLKKCVESLDRAKICQKKPVNWALLELIHMKKKEDTQLDSNEKNVPGSPGQKKKECLASYGDESSNKKMGESVELSTRDSAEQKRKVQFDSYPIERKTIWKRKELVEPSASTERADLLVSDLSQTTGVRPKKINLHLSNIRKWSNAVETMRTLRRYIKKEVAETNELLIGYMLSIDFTLLQAMYKIIRTMLPPTSEITELDALTKYKILIAMDAIELWDKKRKNLSVPAFVNDLFAQVSSIEGFIKMFLCKTSDDSNVEPVLLTLMAHAFGLRIELEWKVERTHPKYRPSKTVRII